jgi:hypothetical protein
MYLCISLFKILSTVFSVFFFLFCFVLHTMLLFAASKLGIKELLPAYLSTNLSNQDLITGVSFASGGAGFDPATSQLEVQKIWNYKTSMVSFVV